MIGQNIAHYRVTAKLGAGGMGEVYRATDTKLRRDVALKVLPEAFAADAQRMARFQREAQLLAALNHPNIAAIYGLEQSDAYPAGEPGSGGIRALVMELVEGPNLAERVAQGAIPAQEALPISKQIAEALEYAHERGIIHRDLKPANIKLTPEGTVKVLDFGLAKALTEESTPAASNLDASPTLSAIATRAGMIFGTAAYMAPEQAKGKSVDRRADVWAFGVVLYEMLSGRRAFHGEDASDMLAAVIKSEPEWSALPATTPPQIHKLLRRCLAKDVRQRLQAIGEARIQIEEVMTDRSGATAVMTAAAESAQPGWRRALPWAIATLMTVAFALSLVGLWRTPPPRTPDVKRFDIDLGALSFKVFAAGSRLTISPDGRKIVGTALSPNSPKTQLYLRSMENPEIVPLPGTEDAAQPFFSPDSQWVGFSAGGKLKKVPLAGGLPVTLCDAPGARGTAATWADNGSIYFVTDNTLNRIPDGGGSPEKLAETERAKGERFAWISSLPSSRGLLLVVVEENRFDIDVYTLGTGKRTRIVEGGSWPRYLPTGHILYAQYASGGEGSGFSGGLLVVPFDVKRLMRTGSPIPVLEGVRVMSGGAGFYDVAEEGTFVYVPGASISMRKNLFWVNRTGKREAIAAPEQDYRNLHLSPDGSRLAVEVSGTSDDIYVYDLRHGTLQRLTFDGWNTNPVFTADGQRIVYSSASSQAAAQNLWWKSADGSGSAQRLTTSEFRQTAGSVSPDGKLLMFSQVGRDFGFDLFALPLDGDRKAKPFLTTRFDERAAEFSPDGKWVAYISNESGTNEVYVQPYPGPGGKWQISSGGGVAPAWSRDGKQLYYAEITSGARIMAVDVKTRPAFSFGTPRVALQGLAFSQRGSRNFDVAPDGRFLVAAREELAAEEHTKLRVVLNFFTEVRRRLPASKP